MPNDLSGKKKTPKHAVSDFKTTFLLFLHVDSIKDVESHTALKC